MFFFGVSRMPLNTSINDASGTPKSLRKGIAGGDGTPRRPVPPNEGDCCLKPGGKRSKIPLFAAFAAVFAYPAKELGVGVLQEARQLREKTSVVFFLSEEGHHPGVSDGKHVQYDAQRGRAHLRRVGRGRGGYRNIGIRMVYRGCNGNNGQKKKDAQSRRRRS